MNEVCGKKRQTSNPNFDCHSQIHHCTIQINWWHFHEKRNWKQLFFWLRPYQLEGIVIKICPLEKCELNWDNISSMALAAPGRQSELWPHFATSTQIRTRRVAHFPPMGLIFVSSLPTQFLLAFFSVPLSEFLFLLWVDAIAFCLQT